MQLSGNLTAWLYRVTVNVCHDHRRHPETAAIGEAGQLPGSAADPHQELARAERKRALDLSLRRLSQKERAALVLRDLEGLSTAEVAATLGSTEATVRSQISKARVKIKKFMDQYFRRRP